MHLITAAKKFTALAVAFTFAFSPAQFSFAQENTPGSFEDPAMADAGVSPETPTTTTADFDFSELADDNTVNQIDNAQNDSPLFAVLKEAQLDGGGTLVTRSNDIIAITDNAEAEEARVNLNLAIAPNQKNTLVEESACTNAEPANCTESTGYYIDNNYVGKKITRSTGDSITSVEWQPLTTSTDLTTEASVTDTTIDTTIYPSETNMLSPEYIAQNRYPGKDVSIQHTWGTAPNGGYYSSLIFNLTDKTVLPITDIGYELGEISMSEFVENKVRRENSMISNFYQNSDGNYRAEYTNNYGYYSETYYYDYDQFGNQVNSGSTQSYDASYYNNYTYYDTTYQTSYYTNSVDIQSLSASVSDSNPSIVNVSFYNYSNTSPNLVLRLRDASYNQINEFSLSNCYSYSQCSQDIDISGLPQGQSFTVEIASNDYSNYTSFSGTTSTSFTVPEVIRGEDVPADLAEKAAKILDQAPAFMRTYETSAPCAVDENGGTSGCSSTKDHQFFVLDENNQEVFIGGMSRTTVDGRTSEGWRDANNNPITPEVSLPPAVAAYQNAFEDGLTVSITVENGAFTVSVTDSKEWLLPPTSHFQSMSFTVDENGQIISESEIQATYYGNDGDEDNLIHVDGNLLMQALNTCPKGELCAEKMVALNDSVYLAQMTSVSVSKVESGAIYYSVGESNYKAYRDANGNVLLSRVIVPFTIRTSLSPETEQDNLTITVDEEGNAKIIEYGVAYSGKFDFGSKTIQIKPYSTVTETFFLNQNGSDYKLATVERISKGIGYESKDTKTFSPLGQMIARDLTSTAQGMISTSHSSYTYTIINGQSLITSHVYSSETINTPLKWSGKMFFGRDATTGEKLSLVSSSDTFSMDQKIYSFASYIEYGKNPISETSVYTGYFPEFIGEKLTGNFTEDKKLIDGLSSLQSIDVYDDSKKTDAHFRVELAKNAEGEFVAKKVRDNVLGISKIVVGKADPLSTETDDILFQEWQTVKDHWVNYGEAYGRNEHGESVLLGYGLSFTSNADYNATPIVVDYDPSKKNTVTLLNGITYDIQIIDGIVTLTEESMPIKPFTISVSMSPFETTKNLTVSVGEDGKAEILYGGKSYQSTFESNQITIQTSSLKKLVLALSKDAAGYFLTSVTDHYLSGGTSTSNISNFSREGNVESIRYISNHAAGTYESLTSYTHAYIDGKRVETSRNESTSFSNKYDGVTTAGTSTNNMVFSYDDRGNRIASSSDFNYTSTKNGRADISTHYVQQQYFSYDSNNRETAAIFLEDYTGNDGRFFRVEYRTNDNELGQRSEVRALYTDRNLMDEISSASPANLALIDKLAVFKTITSENAQGESVQVEYENIGDGHFVARRVVDYASETQSIVRNAVDELSNGQESDDVRFQDYQNINGYSISYGPAMKRNDLGHEYAFDYGIVFTNPADSSVAAVAHYDPNNETTTVTLDGKTYDIQIDALGKITLTEVLVIPVYKAEVRSKQALLAQFPGLNLDTAMISTRLLNDSDLSDGTKIPDGFKAVYLVEIKLGDLSFTYVAGVDAKGASAAFPTLTAQDLISRMEPLDDSDKDAGAILGETPVFKMDLPAIDGQKTTGYFSAEGKLVGTRTIIRDLLNRQNTVTTWRGAQGNTKQIERTEDLGNGHLVTDIQDGSLRPIRVIDSYPDRKQVTDYFYATPAAREWNKTINTLFDAENRVTQKVIYQINKWEYAGVFYSEHISQTFDGNNVLREVYADHRTQYLAGADPRMDWVSRRAYNEQGSATYQQFESFAPTRYKRTDNYTYTADGTTVIKQESVSEEMNAAGVTVKTYQTVIENGITTTVVRDALNRIVSNETRKNYQVTQRMEWSYSGAFLVEVKDFRVNLSGELALFSTTKYTQYENGANKMNTQTWEPGFDLTDLRFKEITYAADGITVIKQETVTVKDGKTTKTIIENDTTTTQIKDELGRLVKEEIIYSWGDRYTYIHAYVGDTQVKSETLWTIHDSEGKLTNETRYFFRKDSDGADITITAGRDIFMGLTPPSTVWVETTEHYFWFEHSIVNENGGRTITAFTAREMSEESFSKVTAELTMETAIQLAAYKSVSDYPENSNQFDSRLTYSNDGSVDWDQKPLVQDSFTGGKHVAYAVVGAPDSPMGSGDDILIKHNHPAIPVNGKSYTPYWFTPWGTYDAKLGIYFQESSTGKTTFVEFPKENRFVMDDVLYEISVDAEGLISLKQLVQPFEISLPASTVSGENNLKVRVDAAGNAFVTWYGTEYAGKFDPDTKQITLSFPDSKECPDCIILFDETTPLMTTNTDVSADEKSVEAMMVERWYPYYEGKKNWTLQLSDNLGSVLSFQREETDGYWSHRSSSTTYYNPLGLIEAESWATSQYKSDYSYGKTSYEYIEINGKWLMSSVVSHNAHNIHYYKLPIEIINYEKTIEDKNLGLAQYEKPDYYRPIWRPTYPESESTTKTFYAYDASGNMTQAISVTSSSVNGETTYSGSFTNYNDSVIESAYVSSLPAEVFDNINEPGSHQLIEAHALIKTEQHYETAARNWNELKFTMTYARGENGLTPRFVQMANKNEGYIVVGQPDVLPGTEQKNDDIFIRIGQEVEGYQVSFGEAYDYSNYDYSIPQAEYDGSRESIYYKPYKPTYLGFGLIFSKWGQKTDGSYGQTTVVVDYDPNKSRNTVFLDGREFDIEIDAKGNVKLHNLEIELEAAKKEALENASAEKELNDAAHIAALARLKQLETELADMINGIRNQAETLKVSLAGLATELESALATDTLRASTRLAIEDTLQSMKVYLESSLENDLSASLSYLSSTMLMEIKAEIVAREKYAAALEDYKLAVTEAQTLSDIPSFPRLKIETGPVIVEPGVDPIEKMNAFAETMTQQTDQVKADQMQFAMQLHNTRYSIAQSLQVSMQIPPVINQDDMPAMDAKLTKAAADVRAALNRLKEWLTEQGYTQSGESGLTELSAVYAPQAAKDVEQQAMASLNSFYTSLMSRSIQITSFRGNVGEKMLVPVSELVNALIGEMDALGLGRWSSPEDYLQLKGLTEGDVGDFNPGDGVFMPSVFDNIMYDMLPGPSLKDLRNMVIRFVSRPTNSEQFVGTTRINVDLFKTLLQGDLLSFPEDVLAAARANLSESELAMFEEARADIGDTTEYSIQMSEDGKSTAWTWTSKSNSNKTYSLTQSMEEIMNQDGSKSPKLRWSFYVTEKIIALPLPENAVAITGPEHDLALSALELNTAETGTVYKTTERTAGNCFTYPCDQSDIITDKLYSQDGKVIGFKVIEDNHVKFYAADENGNMGVLKQNLELVKNPEELDFVKTLLLDRNQEYKSAFWSMWEQMRASATPLYINDYDDDNNDDENTSDIPQSASGVILAF